VLLGRIGFGERTRNIGVRNGRAGLEAQVDGSRDAGAAGLAEALPLQIIDPDIHNLVAGGPDERRRYLDWIAFHVEHGYLALWRRFRRALKQRNAALRDGADACELRGWDTEFCLAAEELGAARERALEAATPALEATGERLLGGSARYEYRSGWPAGRPLCEALLAGLERDRQLGTTQYGPHRADLRLNYDERLARKLISRGQQKLLACSLVLAATGLVQGRLGRQLLLLLDDPAAELDEESLERLMATVADLDCQVVATALEQNTRLFQDPPTLFHVEQGVLRRLS
jgi:DNA replication and repair protein RecF